MARTSIYDRDFEEGRSFLSGHELIPPVGFESWEDFSDSCHVWGSHSDRWYCSNFNEAWFRDLTVPGISNRIENANARSGKRANHEPLLTVEQWGEICLAFDNSCAYCGSKGNLRSLHMDHVLPFSKGGVTTLGNIVPACRRCNSRKRAKDPDLFIESLPNRNEVLSRMATAKVRLGL